jgi:hypothetical protein
MQCQPQKYIPKKVKVSYFFKFKKDNSVKNHVTKTKFKLDLYFLVKYLHMRFQPYPYNSSRVQKLKNSIFFERSRGITVQSPWVKVGNFKNPENPELSSFSTVLHRK